MANLKMHGFAQAGLSSMLRCWLQAAFCLVAFSTIALAQEDQNAAAIEAAAIEFTSSAAVQVQIEGRLLTLHAESAPLAEVLQAIGEAGSFRVVLHGELSAPVSDTVADEPLEDAIRHLVGNHQLTIQYRHGISEQDVSEIVEIRVRESRQEATAFEDGGDILPTMDPSDTSAAADTEVSPNRASFREAQLETPPTREDLLFDLNESDQATRVIAVPKVGMFAPGEALRILAWVFANENNSLVRSRAVAALAKLDHPGVRSLLRDLALLDKAPSLRVQAMHALAARAGERSINIIKTVLRLDADPDVRMAAVKRLQSIGGAWVYHALERALDDPDPRVGAAAQTAIRRWNNSPVAD